MAIGTVTTSGGNFYITTIDENGLEKTEIRNLGQLMIMLNLGKVNSLDDEILELMSTISNQNKLVVDLSAILDELKNVKEHGSQTYINNIFEMEFTAPSGKTFDEIWQECFGGDSWMIGGVDANIKLVNDKLESLNDVSQSDNINLQSLLEKRGNAFELSAKVMDSTNTSLESILRNV